MANITHKITLSTTRDNYDVGTIKVRRADDETQIFDVEIIEDGKIKPFPGLTPFFCLMAREITGQGVSEEPVKTFDAQKGTLKHTLSANAFQMVGRNEAYFSFRKELSTGEWVEQYSTRSFYYTVEKSIYTEPFKDSNYWFTFKELYRLFNQYMEDGKASWEDFFKNGEEAWQDFVDSNREILESIDPGGAILTELIDARKDTAGNVFSNLNKRLNTEAPFDDVDIEYSKLDTGTEFCMSETDAKLTRQFPDGTYYPLSGKASREHYESTNNALIANASTFNANFSLRGVIIHEGELIENNENILKRYYLCIDENGILSSANPDATAAELLDSGARETLIGFCPLIENGKIVGSEILEDSNLTIVKIVNPIQIVYQYSDGRVGFFTVNGRLKGQDGMAPVDAIPILLEKNVQFAYLLDGGGSVQTCVRGRVVNRLVDNSGTKERQVADFLVLKNNENADTKRDDRIRDITVDVGRINKELNDLYAYFENRINSLGDLIVQSTDERFNGVSFNDSDGVSRTRMYSMWNDETNEASVAFHNYMTNKRMATLRDDSLMFSDGTVGKFYTQALQPTDLNDILANGFYWATAATLNSPGVDQNWSIIHNQRNMTNAVQIAYTLRSDKTVMKRVKISDVWYSWTRISVS